MKIKVGIFMGGPSRQREQSFASGRTYFLHLDRTLFEPVPLFVDSRRQFLLLDWKLLFQPSLQAFFPPQDLLPPTHLGFPIYEESLGDLPDEEYDRVVEKTGRRVAPEALGQLVNLAVIALQGAYGADGQLQTELDALRIPYTGSNPMICRYNADPLLQREIMKEKGIPFPAFWTLAEEEWRGRNPGQVFESAAKYLGLPFQVFPASDPGKASLIDEETGLEGFQEAVESAFFTERIPIARWQSMGSFDRADHIRYLTDLRAGLGFPVEASIAKETALIRHPEELLHFLNRLANDPAYEKETCTLKSCLPAERAMLESRLMGEPFHLALVRNEDQTAAAFLPLRPSEGLQENGLPLPDFDRETSEKIRSAGVAYFTACGLQSFGLASGIVDIHGNIFFHQLETLPAFSPDSPFFQSGPRIGLSPTDWITLLIRTSLRERLGERPAEMSYRGLQSFLNELWAQKTAVPNIGVIYSPDPSRGNQAPETARQIVQYLAAQGDYAPIPIALGSDPGAISLDIPTPYSFWSLQTASLEPDEPLKKLQIPASKSRTWPSGPFLLANLPDLTEGVVIATGFGPAGGALQRELESMHLPFSGPASGQATVATNRPQSLRLFQRQAALNTPEYLLLTKPEFEAHASAFFQRVESCFTYPFLARPIEKNALFDTLIIRQRQELEAFTRLSFRPEHAEGVAFRKILRLKPVQTIPRSDQVMFQEIVHPKNADHFLPLHIGAISWLDTEGNLQVDVLAPLARRVPWYAQGSGYLAVSEGAPPTIPARLSESAASQLVLSNTLKSQAEKAIRLAGLFGATELDFLVRIYEDDRMEVLLEDIHPFPGWAPEDPLITQLLHKDQYPGETLSRLVGDAVERNRWMALQKEAQTEHLISYTSPFLSSPAPEEPFETYREQTPATAMEPSTHPPSKPGRILPELPSTGIVGMLKDMVWDFWFFISSAIFLKNLVALILLGGVSFLLLNASLNWYTHHGQSVEVQDYRGMSFREAKRKARARSFDVVVNDSVYIVGKAQNTILDQIPKPASRIKKNRNIYLTISSGTPPEVPLPNLVGGNDDYEQYSKKLSRLGINARIKTREFNADLEDNTILYLIYDGQRISAADLKRGVNVPKGSTIDFVVSIRNTGTVDIPNLVCLTYEEAAFLLRSSQLVVGSVFAPGEASSGLFVYKQEPEFVAGLKLNVGEQVNLYLTETRPEGCNEQ
ncbi:MAG: PASTA domain-containing protein [Haliscomenobacter sp.]|nr:PASTA domain-containing protein [Haliscomenobacter sp.]